MTDSTVAELIDPQFWRMPLEDRMARFAELREIGPFLRASFDNPMTGLTETFWVTTRYAEVVEISRRPEDFCSGRGAVSIPDMPAEALEFFGSFINMDDPRHARQRGIVVALVHAAAARVGARFGRDDLQRGDRRHVRAGRGRPRRRRSRSRSRCWSSAT